ncbi:uncharacterized protein BP5553_01144 [Venustampulla echinocandica]|uniref:Uncharacterized protein n=1 Tax=Venustampulla echinocandica TaxID=2656787 RepID=A0A370U074_9HELO|nr:uncharacterized protein BP5553_01144 [Venustampulla echinocandica]RDL41165.1 hypothetical protein BP5553_01144 [Venustampulla echinocandica]
MPDRHVISRGGGYNNRGRSRGVKPPFSIAYDGRRETLRKLNDRAETIMKKCYGLRDVSSTGLVIDLIIRDGEEGCCYRSDSWTPMPLPDNVRMYGPGDFMTINEARDAVRARPGHTVEDRSDNESPGTLSTQASIGTSEPRPRTPTSKLPAGTASQSTSTLHDMPIFGTPDLSVLHNPSSIQQEGRATPSLYTGSTCTPEQSASWPQSSCFVKSEDSNESLNLYQGLQLGGLLGDLVDSNKDDGKGDLEVKFERSQPSFLSFVPSFKSSEVKPFPSVPARARVPQKRASDVEFLSDIRSPKRMHR